MMSGGEAHEVAIAKKRKRMSLIYSRSIIYGHRDARSMLGFVKILEPFAQ